MRRSRFAPVAALVLLLVACDAPLESGEGPTPRPISQSCRDAFAEAIAVDEEQWDPAGEGDDSDLPRTGSLSSLLPTVTACGSVEEWFEAYRANWTERTEGITPSQALRILCRHARDEEVRGADVCRQIAVEGPGDHPGEDSD